MLFVACFEVRSRTEEERVARRIEWEIPEGISVEAEYWLHTPNPEVILVFEADSFAAMMQITSAWNDVYDVKIYPAVEGEKGVKMVKEMTG